MAFELQEGQMFIFTNKGRDAERNQATHNGSVKIDGVEYWVNCWIKDGKNGRFFSCNLKEKEEKYQKPETPTKRHGEDDFDEDVPF